MTAKLGAVDEYKEAGQLFRDGFSTIGTIIRSYLLLNGILLTAFGVVVSKPELGSLGNNLQTTIGLIGAFAALVTCIVHRRMTLYFRGWLQRAAELENGSGLSIYTDTLHIEVSSRRDFLQTYFLMNATYFCVGLIWLSISLVAIQST